MIGHHNLPWRRAPAIAEKHQPLRERSASQHPDRVLLKLWRRVGDTGEAVPGQPPRQQPKIRLGRCAKALTQPTVEPPEPPGRAARSVPLDSINGGSGESGRRPPPAACPPPPPPPP